MNDTIMNVTLNTIDGVVFSISLSRTPQEGGRSSKTMDVHLTLTSIIWMKMGPLVVLYPFHPYAKLSVYLYT